jgi:hypothetical protein
MIESARRREKAECGENAQTGAESIAVKSPTARSGLESGDLILNLDGTDWRLCARRSGLFIPGRISFEGWRQAGAQIFLTANSCAWWVGDWLAYGENFFRDRYEQAIRDTSLDYQTLRNYAWVAKKFTMSRRRDSLSFGHHAEVAALPETEQDVWLTRAERFTWSRNELRRRIRATHLANQSQSFHERGKKIKILKINVTVENLDRWRHAAERTNYDAEWIIKTLDKAAARESGSSEGTRDSDTVDDALSLSRTSKRDQLAVKTAP